MDDFKPFDFQEVIDEFKDSFNEKAVADRPKKVLPKILYSLLATAVISAIIYYFTFPALNFHAKEFYYFLIAIVAVFMTCFYVACGATKRYGRREYVKQQSKYPLIIVGVIAVIMLVGSIAGATLFRARSYNKLMTVQSADFSKDFEEIKFSEVPRLDKDSTKALADNKLNELSEYVSQFMVSENSYQINYKGRPVRVIPLEYGDFFKWVNNVKSGLPAYMIVDMVKQDVTVVELEQGMRYSPTELFNRKLERHLRFQFPTAIFDQSNFEIDENGNPYWITAVLQKKIGLFGGDDVKGAVITNAVTGESTYYDVKDVPNWVDRVYNDELIINQYNYYGKFQRGFINSVIGQKDVTVTSLGNGYIALNDDVWLYTGVTSATSDASNVGFILCNQRTKETRYYQIGGATETGAMTSAEGAVQDFGYKASFPILLNVSGEPTYFMPLKGSDNTVKKYAMVSFKQRTIFGIGDTVEQCAEAYEKSLVQNGVVQQEKPPVVQSKSVTGQIEELRTAVKNGNTVCYIKVGGKFYSIDVNSCEQAIIMNVGDKVVVEYSGDDSKAIIPASKVDFAK